MLSNRNCPFIYAIMQHVFPYIKPVKIYIMHGLCYHVTHRYAVVNGLFLRIVMQSLTTANITDTNVDEQL
jgi:hypothetical protein